jgi:GT2 family glycosyltransferase
MDIVVYDNSPTPMLFEREDKLHELWNLHYIHDQSNPGVSKAYNSGVKIAEKLGKKWIFLLDQDTDFQSDSLLRYCEAISFYKNEELFAPILLTKTGSIWSPCFYYLKKGRSFKKLEFYGLQSIKNKSLLNSGLIVSVDVFNRVGGYNENIPLYFSDFKFIDKYRKLYRNFILVNTKCLHGVSEIEDNTESALLRFVYYCKGARNSIETVADGVLFLIGTFLRTLKLTFRFKSHRFFVIFYQSFLMTRSQ